jgi:ferric iron reductase protein FhuF
MTAVPNDGGTIVETTSGDVIAAFATLVEIDPKWRVEAGVPEATDGWIRGSDFREASNGPFHALLVRMGERAKTEDRKTLAASFALRFGWAGAVAIGPYLTNRCVPHVGLDNVSIKFRDTTLFERTAVHDPRGWRLAQEVESPGVSDRPREPASPLLRRLRDELHQQAEPVVRALYDWSGFAPKGSWGMITSSWAAQFITVCERLGGQQLAAPILDAFFAGDDEVARMQPRMHPVTMHGITHLYQRRASCCRYYLLPQGNLCASCPLVPHDERLRRNHEFMERQLAQKASREALAIVAAGEASRGLA